MEEILAHLELTQITIRLVSTSLIIASRTSSNETPLLTDAFVFPDSKVALYHYRLRFQVNDQAPTMTLKYDQTRVNLISWNPPIHLPDVLQTCIHLPSKSIFLHCWTTWMTSSHIALSVLIWAPNLGEQKHHLDSTPSVPRNNLFVSLSFGLPYCTMHLQYFVSSFTAEKLVILALFAPKSDLVSHSLSLSRFLVLVFLHLTCSICSIQVSTRTYT